MIIIIIIITLQLNDSYKLLLSVIDSSIALLSH